MTKRIDKLEEKAEQGQERLRDELTDVKSQARSDQAQLIRNTDQCLAESLALATKESQERDAKLNDHDNTYARTVTSLEKRLDAKPDLMMRNLDEILSVATERIVPLRWRAHVRQLTRSRTNFESNHR